MGASTSSFSGLTRYVSCIFFVTITAGCASTEVVGPSQATIDPDSSVVAFSVNTSKLTEYEKAIRPKRLHLQYGSESVSIRLRDGKSGIQRILLEVPASAVLFSQFDLAAGTGLFSNDYIVTHYQPVKLAQGEITYLGRMKIESVKFEESADGSVGEPTAVRIVFSDALEDDLAAWEQQYGIFQVRVPNQQIVGNWGGQDYLDVWNRGWSSFQRTSNRSRPAYTGTGETARGPSPARGPGPSSGPPN